jgi:hypothetical protein
MAAPFAAMRMSMRAEYEQTPVDAADGQILG